MRVLFEPFVELFTHQILDGRADFRTDQLVFRLAGKLWIRDFYGQNAGQTFAGIIARERHFFLFRNPRLGRIFRNGTGERATETGQMGAAITLRDVVRERQHHFVVAVVPPHRDFDADVIAFTGHVDGFFHQRGLGTIEVFDKFLDAALIEQIRFERFGRAQVLKDDAHAGVQKRQFAQTLFQNAEFKVTVAEGFGRGKERHLGALTSVCIAHNAQVFFGKATFEACVVFFAIAPDAQLKEIRKRIHNRHTNTVQAARHLIGVLVKFAARM